MCPGEVLDIQTAFSVTTKLKTQCTARLEKRLSLFGLGKALSLEIIAWLLKIIHILL